MAHTVGECIPEKEQDQGVSILYNVIIWRKEELSCSNGE